MGNEWVKRLKLRLAPALSADNRPVMVWLTLVLLTLISAALAEGTVTAVVLTEGALVEGTLVEGAGQLLNAHVIIHSSPIILLLVVGIVLLKGGLVIDYFMGLKHTQGWPQRIMKGYLGLMLLFISVCFLFY
jgi:hypothetical protein